MSDTVPLGDLDPFENIDSLKAVYKNGDPQAQNKILDTLVAKGREIFSEQLSTEAIRELFHGILLDRSATTISQKTGMSAARVRIRRRTLISNILPSLIGKESDDTHQL